MLFAITLIASLIVASFFGHVVHWLIHQKWMGPAYRGHMEHRLHLVEAVVARQTVVTAALALVVSCWLRSSEQCSVLLASARRQRRNQQSILGDR